VSPWLVYHFYSLLPRVRPPVPYTTLFRSDEHTALIEQRPQLRRIEPVRLVAWWIAHASRSWRSEQRGRSARSAAPVDHLDRAARSEEHTSELQSREKIVCRLLLEKKNFIP